MPTDKRPWMSLPVDFLDHPKIKILSDNAIITFLDMNAYSRRHDLDGCIPVAVATAEWRAKSLKELLNNHPERPSLAIIDGEYVIHNYAEHQETRASIAARLERNRTNGAKGGRPKTNLNITDSDTKPVRGNNRERTSTKAESESESEVETDVTNLTQSSQVSDGSNSGLDAVNDVVQQRARRAGIGNLAAVCDALAVTTGEPVSSLGAVLLAEAIVSKAKRVVNNVDAYIATTCRRTPAEVQQAYFDLDIGAVA